MRSPFQIVLGHSDTVWPTGTLDRMPVVRAADCLHGPGVHDTKGGLVQAIFALKVLFDLGLVPAVAPLLVVNSDEEIGSPKSTRWIARLARRADRVLVVEPPFGQEGKLKTARKGVLRFTIRVRGRPAHAGMDPDAGVSAVRELAALVEPLYELGDASRGVTVNVGCIEGGTRPNVVAAEAHALVDIRVATLEDAAPIESRIRALRPRAPGASIEVEGGLDRPPMERTPGNRKLWYLARDLAERLGMDLEETAVGGASDGCTTSLTTPTLDGLGAVGAGAHARDEHVILAHLPRRTALLAHLLLAPPVGP